MINKPQGETCEPYLCIVHIRASIAKCILSVSSCVLSLSSRNFGLGLE